MKTLVVVESPKKAKEIQKYLGDDYVVRPSTGHIADLVCTKINPLGIKIKEGFKPIYAPLKDKTDIISAIIDAAKHVDQVYLASDPDREGEAIAWHIASLIENKVKKDLLIKRVLFHEITKTGIKKGISEPKELDKNLYDAQQARRVLDRVVGYMVSPYLIDTIGPKLSAGRVQSVALRLIVDKEREIEAFKPEEYWTISANFAKENGKDKFAARYSGNKITNKENATKIKSQLDTDTFEVKEVLAEEKPKKPNPPFETVTLQETASAKCKMSVDRVMKAAQSLYESGKITYHRVDLVSSAPEAIADLRKWLKANGHFVPDEPVIYTSKGIVQGAHEGIRPTDINNLPDKIILSDDEKVLYKLIWERFVASQMKPAIYDTVNVTIKSSSGHCLKASGKMLKFKGWLEIINAKEDDEVLPVMAVGDKLILSPPKVKAEKKETKPPARYFEHSLVKELKHRGIGRPSTYAPIVSKIADKGYVKKVKEAFHATDLGKKIVDNLSSYFDFMKIEYTKEMEEKLDKIADGELLYVDMLNGFYPSFQDQLKKAEFATEIDYGFRCSKCNNHMRLKHGQFGYYMACLNYPNDCKGTESVSIDDSGKPVHLENNQEIVPGVNCPKCKGPMIKRQGQFGPFYKCYDFKCTGKQKVPYGKKCSDCGKELYSTIWHGQAVLFCMGYPACKHNEPCPAAIPDPKVLIKKK